MPAPPPAADAPLYDRLGGERGLRAIVDDFVAVLLADARVSASFAGADLERLRAQLVDQLGQASGGPQRYHGRDMRTAHEGKGIDGAQFDAWIEDLGGALDRHGAGAREKAELLAVLVAMRPDVVERERR